MRKKLIGVLAAALVLSAGSMSVSAAGRCHGSADRVCVQCSFVDDDGDGICDNCNFTDADGDGICDNNNGTGCRSRHGARSGCRSGHSARTGCGRRCRR